MTTRQILRHIRTGFLRGIAGGGAFLALLAIAEIITNGLKWGHL
ncbi:hypothetical protein ACPRNU_00995 [Chromobacterium vaccinii]